MTRTRVRWGRVACLALAGSLAAGLAVGAGLGAAADDARLRTGRAEVQVHEVRAGETIWSIARGIVGPDGDPRPLVDAVIGANHIRDAEIFPGQLLVVPRAP